VGGIFSYLKFPFLKMSLKGWEGGTCGQALVMS